MSKRKRHLFPYNIDIAVFEARWRDNKFQLIFTDFLESVIMSKPILYYAEFSPPARAVLLTAKVIDLELELRFVLCRVFTIFYIFLLI